VFKSELTRRIAGNTFYQLAGKTISMVITIFATVLVTRMYGREGYGEFSLMQNFPALFFIIVDFGFNAIVIREISNNLAKAKDYISNILLIRIVMSLFLGIFCYVLLRFFPYSEQLRFGIYLSLVLILTQALYATTNIIFQVKLRYDLSAIGYIAGSVLVLVLVLLFSYLRLSIVWVSFAYVLGGLLTFFVNALLANKLAPVFSFRFKVDPIVCKYLIIQSLPLGLMFIFSQINFKADSILLSILKLPSHINLSNTEAVGIYSLPYKMFEVSLVIPTFFMNAVYPVLVSRMVESKEKLKSTFFKSYSVLFGFGTIVSALGILFAPLAIDVLGGANFSQSVNVLRLLMVGNFVFYLTSPLAWLIVTLGKQKYLPGIYLVSAVFNVAANLVFIPRYAFFASSVITWISELLILALLSFFTLKAWKLKYA